MTEARPQPSERLARAIDDEIARQVRSTIVPLAWAFGGVSTAYALAHLFYLSGALRWRMVCLALVAAAISFAMASSGVRRRWPLSAAHAQQTLIGALPLANCAAQLLWTLEPAQTTNLALLQLAAGFLSLSPRWFAVYTCSVSACVARAAYLAHGNPAFHHFLFMLGTATAAAITVHVIHVRAVRRVEHSRILSDWQTQARLSQQETVVHLGHLAVVERDPAQFLQRCVSAVSATLGAAWVSFERSDKIQAQLGAPLTAALHRESVRAHDVGGDAVLTVHVVEPPLTTITPFLQAVVHLSAMSLRRAALEEQHLDAERRVLQAQRMESVALLAGGVAHDFNNLLTVILGHADVLRFRRGIDADARAALEQIVAASQLAARLTQQLLAFGRKQPLLVEVFDLRNVVTHLEAMLRRTIRENIAISVQLTDAPCTVKADRAQLEQVVMNLVVNARDALTADGAIKLEVTRWDHGGGPALPLPAGSYVVLTVRDDGSGIDEGVLPHIFEPFFTTKPHDRGTGLGLATVHGIVHQCGGTISVHSARAVGTTFTVYLPYCDPDSKAPVSARPRMLAAQRAQRVLVVEDNDAVRSVVVSTLRDARYDVLEAASGAQALQLSRALAEPLDLLLSDVVMPELSGIELAQQLLQGRPGLSVLFMSGHLGDELSVEHVPAEPAPRLLHKPFTAAELLQAIEDTLQHAAAERRAS